MRNCTGITGWESIQHEQMPPSWHPQNGNVNWIKESDIENKQFYEREFSLPSSTDHSKQAFRLGPEFLICCVNHLRMKCLLISDRCQRRETLKQKLPFFSLLHISESLVFCPLMAHIRKVGQPHNLPSFCRVNMLPWYCIPNVVCIFIGGEGRLGKQLPRLKG